MPRYRFECGCGVVRDVVRSVSESGKGARCPGCGKRMKRDFSTAGVRPDTLRDPVCLETLPSVRADGRKEVVGSRTEMKKALAAVNAAKGWGLVAPWE